MSDGSGGAGEPHALLSVLRGSAVPYGYTLTVLASHSIVASQQGGPNVVEIIVFVIGAMLGFATLAAIAEHRGLGRAPTALGRREYLHAGMIHVFAVGAALVSAILIALIPGLAAWGLAAFAATVLYLTITSLELDFATRIDED
ncbi:MAG: hypothetical protein R2725_11090 [Solirubrobacterales bacterium]